MEKIVIIDCRADDETVKSLSELNLTIIPTTKLDCVYDAIASHADIQIHYLGKDTFVCAPEVYDYYNNALPQGFTLIKGSKVLSATYPNDIAYNAAAVGNNLICNSRSTAIEILRVYSCKGRSILSVNQGYAKCSTCVVGANAIITADTGIAEIAKSNGIDVLEITQGHIELKGMDYGFIGGATGLIEKNVLAFNGEVSTHLDGEIIKNFCKKHNVEIKELKNGSMTDIGSIIANIDFC